MGGAFRLAIIKGWWWCHLVFLREILWTNIKSYKCFLQKKNLQRKILLVPCKEIRMKKEMEYSKYLQFGKQQIKTPTNQAVWADHCCAYIIFLAARVRRMIMLTKWEKWGLTLVPQVNRGENLQGRECK